MKSRVGVVLAVLAVLGVGVLTAVVVSVSNAHDDQFGHRADRTSSQSDDLRERRGDGQQRGWRAPTRMMSGPSTMHQMRVRSEYAYLVEMLAHHAEAVSAARQLERSERPQMRSLGRAIITSQTAQIDQMEQWVADWYPGRSGPGHYQPMMRDLSSLEGDNLDRAFLQDMLWHHMGAVMMSQQLLMGGVGEHPQVEVLAKAIRDEQRAEIVQMQRWLRWWFHESWQHGA